MSQLSPPRTHTRNSRAIWLITTTMWGLYLSFIIFIIFIISHSFKYNNIFPIELQHLLINYIITVQLCWRHPEVAALHYALFIDLNLSSLTIKLQVQ